METREQLCFWIIQLSQRAECILKLEFEGFRHISWVYLTSVARRTRDLKWSDGDRAADAEVSVRAN